MIEWDRKLTGEGLSFDDILLVPAESGVLPKETDVRTQLTSKITLNVPLVSSAMDTVSETELAIALARAGGLTIIHKNQPIERQAEMVRKVKRSEAGPLSFHVRAWTPRPVREVVIWRNNAIAYRVEPNATELDFTWIDENPPDNQRLWYYVRLLCEDGEQAWSSPIWFIQNQ